ncbi:MAG: hypothetical protein L0H29_10340, partial [Sinobacteraceae bacterium]|nr:hypothetical protein [Nevskiaceae bacterium]
MAERDQQESPDAAGGAEALRKPLHEEAPATIARFFFANLFDLRMQSVVSMAILPVVYVLGIAITAGGVITLIVLGFE